MRQCPCPAIPDDAVVVENFIKLGGGSAALPCCQVSLTAHVRGIETGSIVDERNRPELDGGGSLQGRQSGSRMVLVQSHLRPNRGQPERLHLRVKRKAFSQVLGQRLGSPGIARHGERKGSFGCCRRTLGSKLCRCYRSLPRFCRTTVGSLALSGNRQIDRPNF